VVGRHVEGVEVEPLVLDLGALGDLPAHRDEHVGDPLLQRGERVPHPHRDEPGQERDVDPLLDEHPRVALLLERLAARVERLLQRPPYGVDPLAGVALRCRGQRGDLAVGERDVGAVAEVGGAGLGELVQAAGGSEGGEPGVAGPLELGGVEQGDLLGVVVGRGHNSSRRKVQAGSLVSGEGSGPERCDEGAPARTADAAANRCRRGTGPGRPPGPHSA
jgi:hypothetical protein